MLYVSAFVPEPNKNPHITSLNFQHGSEISRLTTFIYVHYYNFFSTAVILVHLLHYIIRWQKHVNDTKFYRIFYNIQKFISLIRSALTTQIWDSYIYSLFVFMVLWFSYNQGCFLVWIHFLQCKARECNRRCICVCQ